MSTFHSVISKQITKILKPKMITHFSTFINPGDLIFDVGANIGKLSQVFLDLQANVICVEPHPYCIKVLDDKFRENKNVNIVSKGLSDKEGKLQLYTSPKGLTAISTFSNKWRTKGRFKRKKLSVKIETEVTTLDNLIDKYGMPKFCKLDVEGHEFLVLKGLSVPIPHISFEFVKEFPENTKLCIEHLESLGNVEFNYSLRSTYRFRSNIWTGSAQIYNKLTALRGRLICGDVYARYV